MLKIRDDVDLKELEKYGFELNDWGLMGNGYLKNLEYNDFVFIRNDNTRLIFCEFEDVIDIKACELKALGDLMKAGLVEKVGD